MVKKFITIIFIVILVIGVIIGINYKSEKWYDDLDYYTATKICLKRNVNYPETFEFVKYPKAKFGSKEERTIEVSGEFKCANGYGVYTTHKYVILFEVQENWIIKYCTII